MAPGCTNKPTMNDLTSIPPIYAIFTPSRQHHMTQLPPLAICGRIRTTPKHLAGAIQHHRTGRVSAALHVGPLVSLMQNAPGMPRNGAQNVRRLSANFGSGWELLLGPTCADHSSKKCVQQTLDCHLLVCTRRLGTYYGTPCESRSGQSHG